MILACGTHNLSIDDIVWSPSTWVVHNITWAVIIVAYAGPEVTETPMPKVAVSTECDCWLISNVT